MKLQFARLVCHFEELDGFTFLLNLHGKIRQARPAPIHVFRKKVPSQPQRPYRLELVGFPYRYPQGIIDIPKR
jgi:hypothetical protein